MDAVASLLGLATLVALVGSIFAGAKMLRTKTPLLPRMLMAASVACAPMAALCLLNFVASWMIDLNAPCSDMLSCSAKASLENVVASRWLNFGLATLAVVASFGAHQFAKHLLTVGASKAQKFNPL